MRFANRVERLSGEGADAWKIHSAAVAAKREGADVIIMSIGDPDFATPPAIVDAATRAMQAGDTHYTDIDGRLALRTAIAKDHQDRGGPPTAAENVIVLAGAQNALFSASLCLFEPGDEVVTLDPTYVTYEATIRASGADIVRAPPGRDGGFRPDPQAIEQALTRKTRAILLATPNNPSGVVLSASELEQIADIARRNDLWVISDEVYAALTFGVQHRSIAALDGMRDRTVTVGSLSKAQAMTGWRCGWIVGPEALISHVHSLSLCMLYGLPGFVQEAAVTALTEARGEMAAMRDIYRRRRDLVCAALANIPELAFVPPDAGMFLLVDVRGTGLTSSEFSWGLLREAGVAVLDATPFGQSAAGYVRLSFTLGEAELAEGCARIGRYVAGLRQPGARRAQA